MDYMRIDSRIEVLKQMMSSFKVLFDKVKEDLGEDHNGYWDMIYADEMEHVVGMAFIALQNYINSSISDLYPKLKNIHTHYSIDEKIEGSNTTRINLIIVLANYYKHRDQPDEIKKHTREPLVDLGIKFENDRGIGDEMKTHITGASSPVFEGLDVLSKSWDLNDLIIIVMNWREIMWLNEEKLN